MKALGRAFAKPSGLGCFACLYMMQRAVADSSPFYTAQAQQRHAIGMSGEANSGRDRYGVDGVPISFPMRSAYRTHGGSQGPGPFPGAPPGWGPPSSPVALQGAMPAPQMPFMPFMQARRESMQEQMEEARRLSRGAGATGQDGEQPPAEGAAAPGGIPGESPLMRVGNPNPFGVKLDYTKALDAGTAGSEGEDGGAALLQASAQSGAAASGRESAA